MNGAARGDLGSTWTKRALEDQMIFSRPFPRPPPAPPLRGSEALRLRFGRRTPGAAPGGRAFWTVRVQFAGAFARMYPHSKLALSKRFSEQT